MLGFGDQLIVGLHRRRGALVIDCGWAMIDERHHRDLGHHRCDVGHVVPVVVRGHQKVELLHAGDASGLDDPVGIAVVVAGEAGVQQHALARRRDEEQRFAALRIHHVHVEGLRGRQSERAGQEEECRQDSSLHGEMVPNFSQCSTSARGRLGARGR